jgi:hypothetical protein
MYNVDFYSLNVTFFVVSTRCENDTDVNERIVECNLIESILWNAEQECQASQ